MKKNSLNNRRWQIGLPAKTLGAIKKFNPNKRPPMPSGVTEDNCQHPFEPKTRKGKKLYISCPSKGVKICYKAASFVPQTKPPEPPKKK